MRILFITGLYPKERQELFASLCKRFGLNSPSNTFQWAVIEGLDDNNADYSVLSAPFLPSYPNNFKQLLSPSISLFFRGRAIGKTIKFVNLIFIYTLK